MTRFRDDARITGGDDSRRAAAAGLADGWYLDSGLPTDNVPLGPSGQDFLSVPIDEGARMCLDWANVPSRGLERFELIRRALDVSDQIERGQLVGQRDTSFSGIISNVYNKAMMAGFNLVPQSWRRWCKISTAKDFKPGTRTGLSDAPILETLAENAEIKTILVADRTEYQQVRTRAGILRVSRETLANDDLQAILAAAFQMGQTADQTVNNAVYANLVSAAGVGPTLNQTGAALFSSTHNNYVSSSGAAPSVTTLDAARKAMRRQAESGRRLNIPAKFLIVTPSLESTARVLVSADRIADHPDNLDVIVEAALEDTSTTAWYLAADQNVVPTYDVAFLGEPAPTLDTKYETNVDALEFRARIDFGVAPLDYRGLFKNVGI